MSAPDPGSSPDAGSADFPEAPESQPTLLLSRISRVPPPMPQEAAAPAAKSATAAPALAGLDWRHSRTTERLGKAGLVLSMMLLLVAMFADLFASNLPVLCKIDGAVYVFPNITRPAALATMDHERLIQHADWMLRPVVFHGPNLAPNEGATPLRPPGYGDHPLGTDRFGNDVFARTVHGTRSYLVFALAAVLASLGLGIFLGAVAGWFHGPADALVSRVVESVSAFPPLVLVLGIQAAVPKATIFTLFLAIALTRWPEVARLVRGEVLLASTREYVLAARALGAPPLRILRKHIMPNVRAALVVVGAMGVSAVVLTEASLDFLRVGTPSNTASWGETMSQFRDAPHAWWLLAFPGVLLVMTIVAYNVMGEALRNALDPRAR